MIKKSTTNLIECENESTTYGGTSEEAWAQQKEDTLSSLDIKLESV